MHILFYWEICLITEIKWVAAMASCWFQDKIIHAKMTATISAIFFKSEQPHTHKQCNQAYMFLQTRSDASAFLCI